MPNALASFPVLAPALPELLLAITALVLVLIGAIRGEGSTGAVTNVAFVALIAAGLLVLMQPAGTAVTFNGAFVVDAFARFMKVAALIGGATVLLMASGYFARIGESKFEFPILVVTSTLGILMMISASDLIALYLGLELSSLSLYVIAAIDRDNTRATEAGLKYFVLGALSSGMLLYGASLVYGFTGSVGFVQIAALLKGHGSTGVIFGLAFILAGLCFKISAVPFHMWTPDVYEGAPTPVTAFFAGAPKIAAMALFVRVVMQAFPSITSQWQQIVVFVAIASMGLGAFAAIGQNNLKRLLAYSSIGHMGYAMVGLAAGTANGVAGVAIYMAIYLVTTLGTFACLLAMRTKNGYVEKIDDLAGLGRTNPGMAFALAMLMFSLAGIPPLAGFFAKWYVFVAAVEAKMYALAVIGVLTSVVGAFYYLRVVKVMYFDEAKESFEPMGGTLQGIIAVSAIFTLVFWLYPAPLVTAASAAAKSLF